MLYPVVVAAVPFFFFRQFRKLCLGHVSALPRPLLGAAPFTQCLQIVVVHAVNLASL